MIRRDTSTDESATAQWILISQIEHARLAGKLAEHWGANGFAPLAPRDELLWAVYHHDDGWREWEQTPEVDPQHGRPRTFTEMELGDSLVIWSASIETARRAGELQAALVAGHFCALARRIAGWKQGDPQAAEAERFVTHYNACSAEWQRAWQAQNPAANTPMLAQRALAQLQFFDALSLWFCCAEAREPDRVETPGGPVLALWPQDPTHLLLAPWPLDVESLNLEVTGRAVAVARYGSRRDLAAAPSQPVLLRWQLRPDSGPAG
jgi:hypothetical protein